MGSAQSSPELSKSYVGVLFCMLPPTLYHPTHPLYDPRFGHVIDYNNYHFMEQIVIQHQVPTMFGFVS